MITHSVDITVYCDRWYKEHAADHTCLHEATALFPASQRYPYTLAKKQFRKEGWMIGKNRQLCPVCRKIEKK